MAKYALVLRLQLADIDIATPDVIIFDIDDTLYDSVVPHSHALELVLQEISLLTGSSIPDVASIYNHSRHLLKLDLDGTASSHSRLLYIQKTLEYLRIMHNLSIDIPEHSLRLENLYWESYLNAMTPAPRLKQLFNHISRKNIKIAAVTDLTANIQFSKLIKLGISEYFDHIVTSEEAGADKPNFNSFSLARDKFSSFGPCLNFWMVGDSPIKDLLGAKNELMATTFLLPSWPILMQPNFSYVDINLHSLSQLADFLE